MSELNYHDPMYDHRMDGSKYDPKIWSPSVHYGKSLDDIRNQPLPSEIYAQRYRAIGKLEKRLKLLDFQITLNPVKYNKIATTIQAAYRGMKKRRFFNTIKDSMRLARDHRVALSTMRSLVAECQFEKAFQVMHTVPRPTLAMVVHKCKILYRMGQFERCCDMVQEIIERDQYNEDAYYMLISALCSRKMYKEAYDTMRYVFNYIQDPSDRFVLLSAMVSIKTIPPNFSNALEKVDALVQRHPQDMNLLLKRASLLLCLHDWTHAIDDLTTILHFQPRLVNVLCLRARAHTCQRDWEKAKTDYNLAKKIDPNFPSLLGGIEDMEQKNEELPMMDPKVIEDAIK